MEILQGKIRYIESQTLNIYSLKNLLILYPDLSYIYKLICYSLNKGGNIDFTNLPEPVFT